MNPWAALIKIRFIKKIKTKSWEENVLECLEMVRERETVEVDMVKIHYMHPQNYQRIHRNNILNK